MAQRHSQYARQEHDCYVTPQWVYDLLYSVETFTWDCAPIDAAKTGYDFLKTTECPGDICTNPPFTLADRFIRHALEAHRANQGQGGYAIATSI